MSLKMIFQRSTSSRGGEHAATPPKDHDKASKRKAAALGVTMFALSAVKESSDAFPPLKSVMGGLTFLLDNHQKWLTNREDVEKLMRRVESLHSQFLKDSKIGGRENQRRTELSTKLQSVCKQLKEIQAENGLLKYVTAGDEASLLLGIVEEVRNAIIEYQVALQSDIYDQNIKNIELDEIRDIKVLYRSQTASYQADSSKTCLRGTRIQVLLQVEKWSQNPQGQQVYWLNGHAGSGKTTIARTFCQRAFADKQLGASFFCFDGVVDRSDLHCIFPTLSYQLATQVPAFRAHVVKTLRSKSHCAFESLTSQLKELLIEPLKATKLSTVIAIDALDECKDDEPASAVLSLLGRYIHEIPLVKFMITGRPEAPIRKGFRLPLMKPITTVFVLHDVKQSQVDQDIALYFRTKLPELVKDRSDVELPSSWPSEDDIKILTVKAAGLFVFAATAVSLITSTRHGPIKQLSLVTSSLTSYAHVGQWGIDDLYTLILEKGYGGKNSDPSYFPRLRQVLGCIVTAYDPLTKETLAKFLGRNINEIAAPLKQLHSVLLVPKSHSAFIKIYHKSFPDYITDKSRCKNNKFFLDPELHHADMAFYCLLMMERNLKKNICGLPPYTMNKDISEAEKASVTHALKYACCFWVKHLCCTKKPSAILLHSIKDFLKNYQIFWFEVMSIVGDLERAVYSLKELQTWSYHARVIDIVEWIVDAQNFVLKYFDAIQESALHIYHSALPFCPAWNLLKQQHHNLLAEEVHVKLGLHNDPKFEEATFRIIKTRSSKLSLVIFAQDGSLIATSGDHSIQIFHAATGTCLATMVLSGLSPKAIAFSGDNIYLLSSWSDKGVRLWDVQTGDLVRKCVGWHHSNVIDVAFSAKSDRFSSLDDCGQIFVQSTVSGILECTLQAEKGTIYCLWSPEDNILITYAPTIIHFVDILSQLSVQSFQEHHNSPSILTINHMSPQVVWMKKDVVVVHNLLTHETVSRLQCSETSQSLQGAGKNPQKSGEPTPKYIVLSPDGKSLILRKSEQLQVYHLHARYPEPVAVIKFGKEGDLVFAPDGTYLAIASAQDGTVSFCRWAVLSFSPKSHAAITYVCTSPDGKLIATGHQDGNVNIWSQKFSYMPFTKEDSYGRSVKALALSPNQEYIAIHFTESGSQNVDVQVWNALSKSKDIQQLEHQITYVDPTFCALQFLDNNNLMQMVVSERGQLDLHFWILKSGQFESYQTACIGLHSTVERPWILQADYKAIVLHHSGQFDKGYRFKFELNTGIHAFNTSMKNRYHLVVVDNWILDSKGRRIVWLPYHVVPSDGNWDEKGNWGSLFGRGADILVLGGKTGRIIVLDFSAVKNRDIIPTSFARDVAQKRIKFVFQDKMTG